MDQAQGIRQMKAQHPVQVIAVTSGKGGVGKSNVTVNLAVTLAQSGNKVMIMDADMGLANIDVLLGLSPGQNLSHVINGECTLEETIVEGPSGIKIVPASSGIAMMSDLTPAQNAGLIRSFSELTEPVDVLLIDTAAGLSDSVVSYTRAAREVIVVVCDNVRTGLDNRCLCDGQGNESRLRGGAFSRACKPGEWRPAGARALQ